ncbi:hypothetical protein AAVH_41834, partial [Aphelenchoides avenae]
HTCWSGIEPRREGAVAHDVVTVGSLAANVNVGVVFRDKAGSPQPFWPSDGVLGFRRLFAGEANLDSTLYGLASAAGAPQVTLFGGDEAKGSSAVLTLGGPDATSCAPAWNRVAQDPDIIIDWELIITG